jgi:hypothetical protein
VKNRRRDVLPLQNFRSAASIYPVNTSPKALPCGTAPQRHLNSAQRVHFEDGGEDSLNLRERPAATPATPGRAHLEDGRAKNREVTRMSAYHLPLLIEQTTEKQNKPKKNDQKNPSSDEGPPPPPPPYLSSSSLNWRAGPAFSSSSSIPSSSPSASSICSLATLLKVL